MPFWEKLTVAALATIVFAPYVQMAVEACRLAWRDRYEDANPDAAWIPKKEPAAEFRAPGGLRWIWSATASVLRSVRKRNALLSPAAINEDNPERVGSEADSLREEIDAMKREAIKAFREATMVRNDLMMVRQGRLDQVGRQLDAANTLVQHTLVQHTHVQHVQHTLTVQHLALR